MPVLSVISDGSKTKADPPIDFANMIQTQEPITVIGMPAGMESGEPSVMIRIPLPDGREVVAETSLRLFTTAGNALRAYYETFHGFRI